MGRREFGRRTRKRRSLERWCLCAGNRGLLIGVHVPVAVSRAHRKSPARRGGLGAVMLTGVMLRVGVRVCNRPKTGQRPDEHENGCASPPPVSAIASLSCHHWP
jgi:hypothetical protein